MITLVDGLFAIGVLVNLGICGLGYYSYRQWNEPGVVPFAAFVGLFGLGGVVGGVGSVVFEPVVEENVIWALAAFISLLFWSVPWALFALQYTGRYTRIRWRTVGALLVPLVGLLLVVAVQLATGVRLTALDAIIGGATLLYVLGLLAVGIFLVVRTTSEYGHLSLAQGVSLSVAPVLNLVLINSATIPQAWSDVESAVVYVGSFAVPGIALSIAICRYQTFDASPAVGAIGERAITRETDDLVAVVDDHERVIKYNVAVAETLDVSKQAFLGRPLSELLGYDVEALRERETVTLDANGGARRYDAQVSTITDQHDRELGFLVSLRDVTQRNLREQRLAVLNRVLRHNLRNDVEVIKGHAEILGGGTHARTIRERADRIANLGKSARTIDQFVSKSTGTTECDLVTAVDATLAPANDDAVSLALECPDSAPVETNVEALTGALESALDNARKYADSTVEVAVDEVADGYEVTITDDGPGIPESELDSLDSGTETVLQHGTGLGLWQLKWAVTTMGGDLAFDTSDGTTVTFTVPDQGRVDVTSGFTESAAEGSTNS